MSDVQSILQVFFLFQYLLLTRREPVKNVSYQQFLSESCLATTLFLLAR